MIAFVSRKILKSSKWYYLLVVVANFSIIQKINNFFHCLDIKKYNYESSFKLLLSFQNSSDLNEIPVLIYS